MGKQDKPDIPKTPDSSQLYNQGVTDYFKSLPQFLGAEQGARNFYDPQRVGEQQALQGAFGPTQYSQMLQAFQQLDPSYYAAHNALGNKVTSDLSLGSALSPDQSREIEQQTRASQVARGNASGSSAGIAEAYAKGTRGLQLEQQRISNVGNFLQDPTIAQQTSFIPPVSADRSSAYVNPNAGFQGQQFGLQNFQNQLGAAQLGQQQGGNPWMSAIGALGSIAGGIIGSGAFSDKRLKTDIKRVGKHESGAPLYEFSYKDPQRFRGVMAQDIQKSDPEHVAKDAASGYYMVSQKYAPEALA